MTAEIIDGRRLAAEIRLSLKPRVDALKNRGVTAGLATVILGENPASQLYVSLKTKAAEELGLNTFDHALPENTGEDELLSLIGKLNSDEGVHGILIQLPLPKQVGKKKILSALAPGKDVDGFHPLNFGGLVVGDESMPPATAAGVVKLIESVADFRGREVVVVSHSTLVGKPLALLLLNRDATVTVCHEFTKDLGAHTSKADILISATGVGKLIKAEMVKEGAIVVDVGVCQTDDGVCGDVDFEKVMEKAAYITPVPGGVGPMTVAMVIANTVTAAEKIHL